MGSHSYSCWMPREVPNLIFGPEGPMSRCERSRAERNQGTVERVKLFQGYKARRTGMDCSPLVAHDEEEATGGRS